MSIDGPLLADPDFELSVFTEHYDGFIGSYDTNVNTDHFLDYFKWAESCNFLTKRSMHDGVIRLEDKGISPVYSRDIFSKEVCSDITGDIQGDEQVIRLYNTLSWLCYTLYENKFKALLTFPVRLCSFNIQQTEPGQGFHMWHSEIGKGSFASRALVTMLYLNDGFEGGETEFLYQNKRVKPKKGRMLIWPADWTHTHRGNPPLNGTKYIATSWMSHAD